MFIHAHNNKELTPIATEIAHAIDMAERYRDELANPEAHTKWYGIWLCIELMLEWLFEEEAKILHAFGVMDWPEFTNIHTTVMEPVRTMIVQCKSGRAHRRANLDALEDIVLILAEHKARYGKVAGTSRAPSSATEQPQEFGALQ